MYTMSLFKKINKNKKNKNKNKTKTKNFTCGLCLAQKNTKILMLWKVPQNQDLLE